MKPTVKRLLPAALLLILPVALVLVIREQLSWRPRVLGQMKYGVMALAWSPDGKTLASGGGPTSGVGSSEDSDDGEILLWNVKTGVQHHLQSEQDDDGAYKLWFLPNDKLACRTVTNELLLYDTRLSVPSSRPQSIKVNEREWAISPNGRQIISQVEDFKGMTPGYFALRDLSSRKIVKLASPDTRSMAINHIAFAPDGKRFAACVYNSPHHYPTVWLWNLETPQIPYIFRLPRDSHPGAELTFWPNSASIAGTSIGQLFVVDIASGQVKSHWRGEEGLLALSSDGKMVARHDSNSVSLYKFPSMTRVRQWPIAHNRFYVLSMAFSPDGRTLAVGDKKGFVTLWRVK